MLSHEYEQILIGAWLTDRHREDINLFNPSDFERFYLVVKNLKDPKLIRTGSGDINIINLARISKVSITELTECINCYSDAIYESAVDTLKRKQWVRELEKAAVDKSDIARLESLIEKYKPKAANLPEPAKELSSLLVEVLEERKTRQIINPGIAGLNEILCGIKRKELTAIGARPSVGKSAFTLQVAVNVANSGQKVLYFPLEMSTTQTIERIVCRFAEIEHNHLRTGRLTDNEWAELGKGLTFIEELERSGNFKIYEGCNTIETIAELVKREKPFMVVVDQLQQLTSKTQKFDNNRARFSYMTRQLQLLAMEQNVAVWLACQVNRAANVNPDARPTMDNLKESGSIEEDSDNVILIHRDRKYEEEQMLKDIRAVELSVAKQRSGETTGEPITMIFNPNRFEFIKRVDGFAPNEINVKW